MDIFDKCEEYTLPRELRKEKLYAYYRTISSGQSPEVTINGQKVVMLGSNNYLGLTENEAAEALGVSRSTVSRRWREARLWLARELSD